MVHQLQIRKTYFLLLPKLNSAQVRVLARRFADKGHSVQLSRLLSAKSKEGTIRIDQSGLCWSAFDPSDAVLPAIPDVLACPKERLPLEELQAMYFKVARSGGRTTLRLAPRIESSSLWDALRSSGECGLAPDEHAVTSFLIHQARGRCSMLTDFLCDGSVMRVYGRRVYYDSTLGNAEAASTLRTVGEKASRNSYLQRDGTLRLTGTIPPSRKRLVELFEGLGEWCFFNPV